MNTHTPGPWTAQGFVVVALGADKVIHLPAMTDGHTSDELRANARLIASAPDLLAALTAIVAMLREEAPGTALNNHRFDALGIQANAAIAKAEGQ